MSPPSSAVPVVAAAASFCGALFTQYGDAVTETFSRTDADLGWALAISRVNLLTVCGEGDPQPADVLPTAEPSSPSFARTSTAVVTPGRMSCSTKLSHPGRIEQIAASAADIQLRGFMARVYAQVALTS